jgi:predicted metal-dependent phosphoesterase TrpH
MALGSLRLVICFFELSAYHIVLIDLHTHTTASDGTLSPGELLTRARDLGVAQLAITDHDTVAGYRAAAAHYTQICAEITLIPGVELSCRWSGSTIHILGLGFDCDHPVMVEGIANLCEARIARAEKIGQRLAARGFEGATAGAMDKAGDSQIGRPHFAAWMVERGHVSSFGQAFDKYLGQGKTGDVKAFWPELAEVTQWVVAAGGVAAIAHPLHYRFTRMKLRRLVTDFKAAGGMALELINGRQTADQTAQLERLAREFELQVSAGSDFHRDSPFAAKIGVELRHLKGLPGVWERWSSQ